jgi:hypothetical protein
MANDHRESVVIDFQVTDQAPGNEAEVIPTKATREHKPSSQVRFSDEEWVRIQNDHFVTGLSIPALLKLSYFKGPPLSPLMTPVDQRATLDALRRIGNNVNQIAKQLNSGFREGWNDALAEVRDSLAALRQFVTGFYGDH